MSHKYNNYSKQFDKRFTSTENPPVLGVDLAQNSSSEAEVPSIDTTPEPEVIYGTVTKCKALNIREEADVNSDKVCVVPAGTKVVIDNLDSAGEWYSITTEAGLSGYCLSEFISIDK